MSVTEALTEDSSPSDNLQLSLDVAHALLTAIGNSARACDSRAIDELRKLSEAYSFVRSSMPAPRPRGGGGGGKR
jgi:hypothetical protein